jgi:hypothetical protein
MVHIMKAIPSELDEQLIRMLLGWHALEKQLGGPAIVDFNLIAAKARNKYENRLEVLRDIERLNSATPSECKPVRERLTAHETFLRALMGQKFNFETFINKTQGIPAEPFSIEYIKQRRGILREALEKVGIKFDANTVKNLVAKDRPIPLNELEENFRALYASQRKYLDQPIQRDGRFRLRIEFVNLREYWGYWVDGKGIQFRLRFNRHNLVEGYTHSEAVQFVYHELLAHCCQMAVWRTRISEEKIPRYFGLTTVHSQEQFLLEGLAQALPLFVKSDLTQSPIFLSRLLLGHFRSLINNNVHIMINNGATVEDCVRYASRYAPFVRSSQLAEGLASRSNNPLYRSYEFVYPRSFDVFLRLAEDFPEKFRTNFLTAVYNQVLFYKQIIGFRRKK